MPSIKAPTNCDFNPLPRKEGDVRDGVCIAFMANISIHSLVKRETQALLDIAGRGTISIHSLVKRETLDRNDEVSGDDISIHSLVKRETIWQALLGSKIPISIHSLVKRETVDRQHRRKPMARFQSTPS